MLGPKKSPGLERTTVDLAVHLRERMKRRSTEELVQLWSSNDKKYSEEALQIVREELLQRGVDVPAQNTRIEALPQRETDDIRDRHLFFRFRFNDDTNLRKMAFASLLLPIVAWVSQPLIAREIRAPEVLLLAGLIQLALIVGGLCCGAGIVSKGRHAVAAFEWCVALVGIAISSLSILIVLGALGLMISLRKA
jgi:hypothetical protein